MALNIKNLAVEKLAEQVSALTGETKTEAIRRALEERRQRLLLENPMSRVDRARRFLEEEVWPHLPAASPMTKGEREELLGYGPLGV